MTSIDPEEEKRLFDAMQKGEKFIADNTKWELNTEVYAINLRNYEPFFCNLEGQKVDIHSFYSDFVIFHEFSTAGIRTTTGVVARKLIKEVNKLNKEFDNRIQVILINTDMILSYRPN